LTRRELLQLSAVASLAALTGDRAAAAGRPIAEFNPAWLPDPNQLARWLKQLHDFGPIRATGTPQARAFEEWLAAQVTALGFTVERDQYRLTSWECDVARDCSLNVVEGGAKKNVEVVAYYPFCGSTRGAGPVSGRVLYVPGGIQVETARAWVEKQSAGELAASIVVIDMPLSTPAGSDYSRIRWYPETFPAKPPETVRRPNPANQGGRAQMELFENRCRGLVLCTNDVANDTARYSYLPFGDQHRKIPCLFVGGDGSKYLQSIAASKAVLTMRCDAKLTPDARADSLAATMKGQTDEVIFLTTHTDGPNEVNDNGALGVLALAAYWSRMPADRRRRTLFLSLPTGHYAGGAIADKITGSGQRAGTSGIMNKRPDVVSRTVAQIQLEQMGAMEWVDQNGTYAPTGNVAKQRWIPTPAVAPIIVRLFMAATETEDARYANSGLVESGSAPGEGGSLRSRNIPGIGLMGSPSFFFRVDPKGVVDMLSPNVMHFEASIAAKLMVLFNRLSVDQLNGKAPISDADIFGS
jgi:hypothetical protein